MLPTAPATGADDLTRIRAIDSGLHAKLHQLGIRRYADIAAWTPADVARVSQTLGFQGRIEQENWIEQAQILSRGGETAFARRKDRGEASLAAPSADQGTPKAIATAPVVASLAAAVAAPVASAIVATAIPAVAPIPLVPAPAPSPVASPVPAAPATAAAPTVAAVAAAPAQAELPQPARVAERAAFATQSAPTPTQAASPIATPAAVATAAPSASVTPSATLTPPALGRDNLQRIGGINAEVERVLNVQGVGKYNQIASWVEKDTTRFDRLLGYEGRIARENWIEQAQILSRNGETAYSRQFDLQHSVKSTVAVPGPAAVAVPTVAAPAAPAAAIAATTVATVAAVTTAAAAKVATTVSSLVPEPPRPARLPDAVAEQIRPAPVAAAPMPPAASTPVVAAPVATPAPVVTMPAAASIAAGVSTVPMPTRTGELAGLRSVRSEAYSPTNATKAGPDDLKRIRGVGVLIERKLNSMGINSYSQIANWTSAEIDRVSQVLDFKGKVERENWVEQARILSAGGQTEFSRRVDRGDDPSKPK